MKIFSNKMYFLPIVIFYCFTTSAQTSKDFLSSLQMKREIRTRARMINFSPRFKPTLITTAVKPEKNNPIIDTRDVRVFPSPNVQSEVHISINKTDPTNLIASANTLLGVKFGQPLYNQGYYFT